MGSGHLDKAAIVSAAGDSVWAKSTDFEVRTAPTPGTTLPKSYLPAAWDSEE